ncbi:uncharacterized protein LOC117070958 [Trachypithecus francoisi]|uniref:uncharacterized protein LOC117070958 n=1 Tax=Trachypithecus francoisi TaxID=54180 RepID=UPI00141B77BA|nr:uncharacterized protein LOC117070958 [Trachypithecus francoisi]
MHLPGTGAGRPQPPPQPPPARPAPPPPEGLPVARGPAPALPIPPPRGPGPAEFAPRRKRLCTKAFLERLVHLFLDKPRWMSPMHECGWKGRQSRYPTVVSFTGQRAWSRLSPGAWALFPRKAECIFCKARHGFHLRGAPAGSEALLFVHQRRLPRLKLVMRSWAPGGSSLRNTLETCAISAHTPH